MADGDLISVLREDVPFTISDVLQSSGMPARNFVSCGQPWRGRSAVIMLTRRDLEMDNTICRMPVVVERSVYGRSTQCLDDGPVAVHAVTVSPGYLHTYLGSQAFVVARSPK